MLGTHWGTAWHFTESQGKSVM